MKKRDTIEACFGFDSSSDNDDDMTPNTERLSHTNLLKQKMKDLQRLLPSPSAGPTRVVPTTAAHPNLFVQTESSKRTTTRGQLFPTDIVEKITVPTSPDIVHPSGLNSSDSFDCVRWGSENIENQEACPALFETLWPEKDKVMLPIALILYLRKN